MNAIPSNPTGWLMSEKLDGCRCIWTGDEFMSRNGNIFKCPTRFKVGMPPVRLDGELCIGRGTFPALVSTIQKKRSDWAGVRFMVFDLAALRMPIEARHAALGRLELPRHVHLVPHRVCRGNNDLDATEAAVVAHGGEGLCLRDPGSYYTPGGFVKVKRIFPDLDRSILD